ncbi:hypothetical protein NDU88_000136 [Pleurodeles waltl]|uniref:Uncharacterized protein n=1 Tax=Pleurodeles waltl TaxID=8319 RepID=A0AAV7V4A2_PLEWA|nr:hypothetical protein NDU88_000136 [Pleurodeles waltl]
MEPVHLSHSRQPVPPLLCWYRHLSHCTTSCRSLGHPLPQSDHTTGLTTREAWWQPQQGVAVPPVSSASMLKSPQGPNFTDPSTTFTPRLALSATGEQPGNHSAAQPENRKAGGCGPTPPVRPTANRRPPRPLTQPAPRPKRPTGQQHTGWHCTATPTSRPEKPVEAAGKITGRTAVRSDCRSGSPLISPGKWWRRRRRRLLQNSTSQTPEACARGSPTRCATRPTAFASLHRNSATDYSKCSQSSTSAGAPPLHRHRISSILTGEMIKKGPSLSGASQSAGHLADWLAPPPSVKSP